MQSFAAAWATALPITRSAHGRTQKKLGLASPLGYSLQPPACRMVELNVHRSCSEESGPFQRWWDSSQGEGSSEEALCPWGRQRWTSSTGIIWFSCPDMKSTVLWITRSQEENNFSSPWYSISGLNSSNKCLLSHPPLSPPSFFSISWQSHERSPSSVSES